MIPPVSFPTDYTSILERIHAIDPVRYANSRNYANGAVTYLSPYISRGVISTRQVYDAVLAKGYKTYQIEKFVQELAWRDYFQQVWKALGSSMFADIKQPQPHVLHYQIATAILNADTGIQAVDESIEMLLTTGYMHNHARMYAASIACNMAGAHWAQPAKWMYYHLLDADLASNTCSWQWVAGSFSSKKYWCNQQNINKYFSTNQQGTWLDVPYEAFPLVEVPDAIKQHSLPLFITPLPKTPKPFLDASLPTLLYNYYNLDPAWYSNAPANRILLLEPSHFAQYPVSQKLIDFVIDLANKNIPGIQVYSGEVNDLELDVTSTFSKEHPAFAHYPSHKDARQWLAPDVTGYYPSFFAYWKKVAKRLV
jgi:deoxyribodipyrimidine photo-lyase